MKKRRTEVAIAGGGLAGTALANLLALYDIESVVLQQDMNVKSHDLEYDPRTLSITPASKKILASMNIWQQLPVKDIGQFREIHVWDTSCNGEISFDSADICEPVLGYIVEQSLLEKVLDDAMSSGTKIENIHLTEPLTFENKDSEIIVYSGKDLIVSADVLVAADGAGSQVRSLAGIGFPRHDYHQTAVACIVRTELPHNKISRQRFLPDGPLAFLPRAEENSSGVVWSTSNQHAEELMGMSEDDFLKHLQQAFDYRLGKVIHSDPRVSFRLSSANAVNYFLDRCVLVGDAAHVVHPLAGQGANMGFMDVAALAELFSSTKAQGGRISSRNVLRRYERWRKAENFRMSITLEAIKAIFEGKNGLIRTIRGIGMNYLDSMDLVKNRIMKHAMGLAGDLPEIVIRELNQGLTDV